MPTILTYLQLRNVLLDQITSAPTSTDSSGKPGPTTKFDILYYLYLTTLDIIGLSGFNYDFNTLRHGEEGNELAAALHRVNSPKDFQLMMFLKAFIPPLRRIKFDQHARITGELHRMLRRIGMALIDESQREVVTEKASGGGTVLEKGGQITLLYLRL
jgi:hypothetical protein